MTWPSFPGWESRIPWRKQYESLGSEVSTTFKAADKLINVDTLFKRKENHGHSWPFNLEVISKCLTRTLSHLIEAIKVTFQPNGIFFLYVLESKYNSVFSIFRLVVCLGCSIFSCPKLVVDHPSSLAVFPNVFMVTDVLNYLFPCRLNLFHLPANIVRMMT